MNKLRSIMKNFSSLYDALCVFFIMNVLYLLKICENVGAVMEISCACGFFRRTNNEFAVIESDKHKQSITKLLVDDFGG